MQPSEHVLSFACASCGTTLTVPVAMAGVSGPCPCCSQVITAPSAPEERPVEPRPHLPRPRHVAGPPEKNSWFTKLGLAAVYLLIAAPFIALGIMLGDLMGMFDEKQAEEPHTAEANLIHFIDQGVHPSDPKWHEQGGVDLTQGAILLEGQRMQNQGASGSKTHDISHLLGGLQDPRKRD